jgi:hypothetical protein
MSAPSLLEANKNVRNRALNFEEQTSSLMEKIQSVRLVIEGSKLLELCSGGKIKEQGVKGDGTAFWAGTKLGTKQLSPPNHPSAAFRPPILEELTLRSGPT